MNYGSCGGAVLQSLALATTSPVLMITVYGDLNLTSGYTALAGVSSTSRVVPREHQSTQHAAIYSACRHLPPFIPRYSPISLLDQSLQNIVRHELLRFPAALGPPRRKGQSSSWLNHLSIARGFPIALTSDCRRLPTFTAFALRRDRNPEPGKSSEDSQHLAERAQVPRQADDMYRQHIAPIYAPRRLTHPRVWSGIA